MISKEKEVATLIENCTSGLPYQIKYFTKYNQPTKIFSDDLTEVVHACMHDTRCGGSGGSGWDTVDNGESKSSSHVQSKKCGDCKAKVTFFLDACPECGSTNLSKSPRDGRWGISSSSHFKYYSQLKEYRLILVEPTTDLHTCRKFRVRYWIIDKDSEHLNAYARGQYDSEKSNHINFQPLKVDFYLSKPVLIFDGFLTVKSNKTVMEFDYFDLNNKACVEIPAKFKTKTSKKIIEGKNFGKERGDIKRKQLSGGQNV